MTYMLSPSPEGVLKRLDHIIFRVPDIERYHHHFRDVLEFPEAWPIGQFWPQGRTSGVALGGINLEFLEAPEEAPAATTLVFEPTLIEAAGTRLAELGIETRLFEKIEADPALLTLRGFTGPELESPQLICRNLLLESDFPVDMFLCDYSPGLKSRLSPARFPRPYEQVFRIEIQLPAPGDIWSLRPLGLQGNIEIHQSEATFGPCRVTKIMLEAETIDLERLDLHLNRT